MSIFFVLSYVLGIHSRVGLDGQFGSKKNLGATVLGHINAFFNDFFCINAFFRTIIFLFEYLTCIIDYCTLEVEIKLIY
jgi:hypothetical protein